MSCEENDLLEFLREHPKEYFTTREISRSVRLRHRMRSAQDDWSKPYLKQMLAKGLVEANDMDHFRIKQAARQGEPRYLVAPRLAAILKTSGKNFGESIVIDENATTYQEYVNELNRKETKSGGEKDGESHSAPQKEPQ